MNSPGKTSLFRMQQTAIEEQERIEISQTGRVREGLLKEPMPSQVAKRDDFAGIVRLIDIITSDQVLLDRLQSRMAARAAPAPKLIDPEADVAVEAEVDA